MALIAVNWRPSRDELRRFGYVCLVAFGGLATWVYFRQSLFGVAFAEETARTTSQVLAGLAGVSVAGSLLAPTALRPLYVTLTAISYPIGFVISHVLMALIYYGLLTPLGLVFRLIGRDALQRRFDRTAATYWEPRRAVETERYFRQF